MTASMRAVQAQGQGQKRPYRSLPRPRHCLRHAVHGNPKHTLALTLTHSHVILTLSQCVPLLVSPLRG